MFVDERRALATALLDDVRAARGDTTICVDDVVAMLRIFERHDLNGDGVLDADEFYALVDSLSPAGVSRALVARSAEALFEKVHEAGDEQKFNSSRRHRRRFLTASEAGVDASQFLQLYETIMKPLPTPRSNVTVSAQKREALATALDVLLHADTVPSVLRAAALLDDALNDNVRWCEPRSLPLLDRIGAAVVSADTTINAIFQLLLAYRNNIVYQHAPQSAGVAAATATTTAATTTTTTTTAATADGAGGCGSDGSSVDERYRAVLRQQRAVVIGAGPAGLRAAIELKCAGVGDVVVLEARHEFTRNNVLLLWPPTLEDLKRLAVRQFHNATDGPFCAGGLRHVSIHAVQRALLKSAILLGVRIFTNTAFDDVVMPGATTAAPLSPLLGAAATAHATTAVVVNARTANAALLKQCYDEAATASATPTSARAEWPMVAVAADLIVCAAGGSAASAIGTLGFQRQRLRGPKTMIGLTFNLENTRTKQEVALREFGIVSYADQARFRRLRESTGVTFENLVYYREHTHHYFVCTPSKKTLLEVGVLKHNNNDMRQVLKASNIDDAKLRQLCLGVAESVGLPSQQLRFARDARQREDRAMFDFAQMYNADQMLRYVRDDATTSTLAAVVGDASQDAFWPSGTGVNRALQSVLSMVWGVQEVAAVQALMMTSVAQASPMLPPAARTALSDRWRRYLFTLTRCEWAPGSSDKHSFRRAAGAAHVLDPELRFKPVRS